MLQNLGPQTVGHRYYELATQFGVRRKATNPEIVSASHAMSRRQLMHYIYFELSSIFL